MKNNGFYCFEKRTEKELKDACVNDFVYDLVNKYGIYEYAHYISVPTELALKEENFVKRLDYTSALNNSEIGINIPKGWQDLLIELSEGLTELNPDLRVKQVKEKFGELRVYTDNATEEQSCLIRKYSQKSRHTCQKCSMVSEEELSESLNGYIATLCSECTKDYLHEKMHEEMKEEIK